LTISEGGESEQIASDCSRGKCVLAPELFPWQRKTIADIPVDGRGKRQARKPAVHSLTQTAVSERAEAVGQGL
jgi:hypothetical protein